MKRPFVECEGTFYVTIQASGIHPLVACMDGMAISMFPKCKRAHIRLDDAIAWHEKELEQSHGTSGSKKALDLLRLARERLIANAQTDQLDRPVTAGKEDHNRQPCDNPSREEAERQERG